MVAFEVFGNSLGSETILPGESSWDQLVISPSGAGKGSAKMRKMRWLVVIVILALLACPLGCGLPRNTANGRKGQQRDEFYLQPLIVQQSQAYPETITGRFVSLADFEDSELAGQSGRSQVRYFSILPAGRDGSLKFVVNITRTGAGAMEVSLPSGASLVFHVPGVHDFSGYTLLTMAIYARSVRDDLMLRISTDKAAWETLPMLLKPGWNNVQIDLARLKRMGDFNPRRVRTIELRFSSRRSVHINVDDIMLVDNRRWIKPVPAGMRLFKSGLDYTLYLPYRTRPIMLRQCDDGLWRLGADQARMVLGQESTILPGDSDTDHGSDVLIMGRRRVGQVELLEHNSIRIRLASTWFFSDASGRRETMDSRKIRWEYTFYRDGRWITDVVVNNVGGQPIRAVKIIVPEGAVFSDGSQMRIKRVKPFTGPIGRWSFLLPPPTRLAGIFKNDFIHPAKMQIRMGRRYQSAGDIDGDGFDQTQGCYCLRADKGHCRFALEPVGKLADPVIRIFGMNVSRKKGPFPRVMVNSEGLAIRQVVPLPDGSILFMLPVVLDRTRWIEATADLSGSNH